MWEVGEDLDVVGERVVERFGLVRFRDLLKIREVVGEMVLNVMNGGEGSLVGCDEEVGGINVILLEGRDRVW